MHLEVILYYNFEYLSCVEEVTHNLTSLIFRACLIYGPGTKLNDERVLNQVILRSIKNKKIDVYGGLNQLRSNLFIYDAINMMIKTVFLSKRYDIIFDEPEFFKYLGN